MFSELAILFFTGMISGTMNSLAGGGSFLAFPMLVFLGLPPIGANASATAAMWPGTLATLVAYRKDLEANRGKLPIYVAISLVGGGIGAAILLVLSNDAFAVMVPYLLLAATLLFTFRARLLRWVHRAPHLSSVTWLLFAIVCVYCGFFGAGTGILLLALFGIMGMHDIHEMNALRSSIGLAANSIALGIFAVFGLVHWPQAIVMGAGGVVGGYISAHYFRKLPVAWARTIVVAIAWTMTLYFFLR